VIYALTSIQVWPHDKEAQARDLPGCPDVIRVSDSGSDVLNLTIVGASDAAIKRVIDAINDAIAEAKTTPSAARRDQLMELEALDA
jgi:hypothetical protein